MSKNFIRKTKVGKITSAFVGITTAVWLSGAAMLMPMTASAVTVDELTAQVNSLMATITGLQAQLLALQGGGTGTACGYTFGVDLKQGSTGADVKNLQIVLNSDAATQVAASGIGSSGNESTYFGSLTKAAVVKFQNKYASEVLTPVGLTAGTGYVGSMTRAKLNALFGTCGPTPTSTPTPTPTGTGISVSSPSQPAAYIAPGGAARLPFTKVTLTAGTDGDVTVNGIAVERINLGPDAVFAGIVLLDENGMQLGIEKTLNSEHKATVGEAFTVKAGQSRTMTIAGNMAPLATLATYAGNIVGLSVTGVSTSATVTGTLPIIGAIHTINAGATIGSVTMARGPIDPGANQTKEVGTTGYTFSSVRATAGSAEKIRVKSIRWNQSGSAAASDLEKVKTYVEGVAYDTTVSSDGKYYTSSFGDGIIVDKGNNIEIAVKGDIVGGSARTIDLDIYKRTDLYIVGVDYGFGITPPNGSSAATADTGAFSSSNPWYDAYQVEISQGTLNVQKCTSGANCEAQNIAVNLANQPLGGFVAEAKGEAISVTQMVFTVSSTTGSGIGLLTNVSLFDENGAIVAGPVDGVYVSALVQSVTFTDTVTFPIGKKTYSLKGKVSSTIGNNGTYIVSFNPYSVWTNGTGQVTGTSVYPTPNSTITLNAMTVKTGALAISVSTVPLAQTVIAGASQFLFANYLLDAGSSGEDVSLSAFPVEYNAGSNATKLTSCTMYDGTTALTTGGNIKNPSAAASSTSFTFDTPLVISKGTTKTVALKCDVAGDATAANVYSWGYDATADDPSPIGKTSGQAITETETDSAGQAMTIAAGGSYTVVDDSTPGYTIVSAGTTGITLLKLKFSATTEDVDIARVNLELGSVASNTPMDLVGRKVTLYDAASPLTSIGEAIFSTSDYATSTLIGTGTFRIPAGSSKTMLVKGDIAAISGTVGPLIASGDLLIVQYDGGANGSANGNYGKGVSSGSNITPTSADVTPTGVRIMKSYPTLAKIDLSSNERLLQTKSDATLYKFKVTASDGDVYLNKFSFIVSSSSVSATTSNFAVYAYTDSGYSTADTTFTSDGLLNYNKYHNGYGLNSVDRKTGCNTCQIGIYANKTSTVATTTYKVPSGQSRWFELRADVGSVESITGTEYITVRLEGDAAWPVSIPNLMGAATSSSLTSIDGDAHNDLVWSPNSTSTSIGLGDLDFTNGYGVVGLPSTNMSIETLTSSN